ncbi:annexin A13-like [Bolinopsis microptera]|uniref:annexin A13-like n=1 Tax=Bolinopsis microptera TaxID=2820187 RepID=UPI00307AD9B0
MTGTIVLDESCNAENDSRELKKAMKGIGTDEAAIIKILSNRTVEQRLDICTKFKKMYGKSLKTELKSELSSHFLKLVKSLILPVPQLLAKEAHRAIKTSMPHSLIEVLIGMDNRSLNELKIFYIQKFNVSIERDLGGMLNVSSGYKRLVLAILQGSRNESEIPDPALAEQDAKDLSEAGPNRFGTEDPVFNALLASRGYEHLKLVFAEYRVEAYEDIGESIRSEMIGEHQEIYLQIVNLIRRPTACFAEALFKIMKGVGTDDDELIRVIVWRSEIDLEEIKVEFGRLLDRSLSDYISDETSGDYRSLLLAIVK